MKIKLLLATMVILAGINVNAQYTSPPYYDPINPGMQTHRKIQMPGTFRGGGMDPLNGYYTVYYKDGTKIGGSGTIKEKKGKQELVIWIADKKEKINPNQTQKLVLIFIKKELFIKEKRDTFVFETMEEAYWMYNVGKKLENVYYAPKVENVAAKKEGDVFKRLTKEEIFALVEGNSHAEKFARKEEYDRAFAEYNQISTSLYRGYKKEK